MARRVYNPSRHPWYLLLAFNRLSNNLQSPKPFKYNHSILETPQTALLYAFSVIFDLSTSRPLLKQTSIFDSHQHLSIPYRQTPLFHNDQSSILSKWSTIASPPQTPSAVSLTSTHRIRRLMAPQPPPCSGKGSGFVASVVNLTIMHFPLRDVQCVVITGAGLAVIVE